MPELILPVLLNAYILNCSIMKPHTPKHQSITFLLAIEKNTENGEIESDQTARERVLANIAIKAPFISVSLNVHG